MSEQHAQGADAVVDLNNELKTRREKLANLREQGIAFPNDFRRDHTSDQLHAEFDGKENEELEALNIEVAVAGRMMTRRIMGKASFVTLQDVGGRIQLYVALPFSMINVLSFETSAFDGQIHYDMLLPVVPSIDI